LISTATQYCLGPHGENLCRGLDYDWFQLDASRRSKFLASLAEAPSKALASGEAMLFRMYVAESNLDIFMSRENL
jgi:hypothetical protein